MKGILYPPARKTGATLGEKCEEFSEMELDSLVNDLKNLPVWVEHDGTQIIGRVERARKTHSNAVEVEAMLATSTEDGKSAIRDIKTKKMVGLSLSHVYNLKWAPNSETERRITVAMNRGEQWQNVIGRDTDITVDKKLRELSVCVEPARSGCHIHDIDPESGIYGAKAASSSGQQISVAADVKIGVNINADVVTGNLHQEGIVGVFNCSGMEPQANDAAPQATPPSVLGQAQVQQNSAPADPANQPRTPDGRFSTATATNPVVPQQQSEVLLVPEQPQEPQNPPEPAKTTEDNKMDEALKSMQEHAAAAAPAAPPNTALSATETEIQTAETLKNACELVTTMRTENDKLKEIHASMEAKYKTDLEQLQQKQQQYEEEQGKRLKAQEEETERLKKEQQAHYERSLKEAQASRKRNFDELQKTLMSITGKADALAEGQVVSGEMDEQQVTRHEAQVTKDAINTLGEYQKQLQQQNSANNMLKRRNEDMATSLHPFGMVNASAAGQSLEQRPTKTRAVLEADMRQIAPREHQQMFSASVLEKMKEFRQTHPKTTYQEAQACLNGCISIENNHAVGIMNASRGLWQRTHTDAPAEKQDLSAKEWDPEMFQGIAAIMSGRIPTPEETDSILKSINTKRDARYM